VPISDPQLEVATVAEGRKDTSAGSSDARSLAAQTAQVALHAEDRVRSTNIALVLSTAAAMGIVNEIVLFGGSSEWLHLAALVLLPLVVIGGVVVRAVRASPERVRTATIFVFGTLLIATSFVESVHLGVFSAFQAVVVLALCVFGLDGRARVVTLAAVACALYFVPAFLIALGVVADPGKFDAHVGLSDRVSAALGMLAVYITAIWQARRSRQSMRAMVERSNEAVLQALQREALLAEANQNLDVILRADAVRGGRYTGASVGGFQLGAVVGRGGMGEVYGATRISDGQPAAVKLLTARARDDADLVQRFLREADIARKLRTGNVVELLAAGEAPDGTPFLAMELLAGHDLGWHLRQRLRLPMSEVVVMVEQVSQGLHAAHDAGIVHRDLKPANLFLHEPPGSLAPVWKILDFGVSKLRDSEGTLTGTALVGTPGYMAPEQVRAGEADARADIFGLGAVTYRALTGQPPFAAQDVQAVFEVVYRQPLAPSTALRGLPRDVDRVLAIALAKEPHERFERAGHLAGALAAASREDLSPELRRRADALLHARPWGSVFTPT
jgi:hypothetical protein